MVMDSVLENKIRTNFLFHAVEEPVINGIVEAVVLEDHKAGDVIFEEGNDGRCLYLLLSGKVKICKVHKEFGEIPIGILQAGEFFGELDLIDHFTRSAKAISLTDTVLARIDKKDFDQLMVANRQLAVNLLRMLSFRLRAINYVYVHREETFRDALSQQLDHLKKVVDAAKVVNSSLDVESLLGIILKTAEDIVGADRGTVYLLDASKKELWSKIIEGTGTVEIRLPIGKGIAGHVGQSGEIINIEDAYSDPRFNAEIDKVTGYQTKTILCMPMKNKQGEIIGVFQLLNKKSGIFTRGDEELIEALSIHAAIAIENAQQAQTMIHNERLSAVGRMASSIIHDIKNPMGVVRLSAQIIQKKSGDQEIVGIAEEMVRQIDRFVAMAQEILDFSRGVSAVNIQPVSVAEFIEIVNASIGNELSRRNVKMVVNLQYYNSLMIDQEKMLRAVYNIAANAADAMPNGGTLTITISQSDGNVVLSFADTGSGMPPDIKAKIFEPFVTYGKRHGTGLGMSIVKKIVDDHKGVIEIHSEVDKGTSVRIALPNP